MIDDGTPKLGEITDALNPEATIIRKMPKRQTESGHLGVLMIVSTHREAEAMQRAFDPRVMHFVQVGGPMTGHRFRAIFVSTRLYLEQNHLSEAAMRQYYQYLDQIRCRLAAGCAENFFTL